MPLTRHNRNNELFVFVLLWPSSAGTSAGIGTVQAVELVKRGATVIGANRNVEKASKAFADKAAASGVEDTSKFHSLRCDLADHASVKAFAEELGKVTDHVDGLALNAGVMHLPERKESKDGVEMQMAANVVGHHLLTSLLIPFLKKAPGRAVIVSTSSVLAKTAVAETFDDLNSEKGKYDTKAVYAATKVGAINWRNSLRKRLDDAGLSEKIHVHTSHPGVAWTSLINSSMGAVQRVLFAPVLYFALASATTAAVPTLRTLLDSELTDGAFVGPVSGNGWKGDTGVYEDYNMPVSGSQELQDKLWAFCEEKTGAKWEL